MRAGVSGAVRQGWVGWSGSGLHWLVLHCLFSGQNIVSKNAMQYRGNAQHDAQEFLLWLLDRVHEDLNNVVNSGGMPPLKVRDSAGGQCGSLNFAHRLSFYSSFPHWLLNFSSSGGTKAWVKIMFVSALEMLFQ